MVNRKNKHRTQEVLSSSQESTDGSSVSYGEDDNGYGTPVRPRKRFTLEETRILEDQFKKCSRPNAELKKKLANDFDTGPNRIQIWFQNRRAKEKKVSEPEAVQNSEGSLAASEKDGDTYEKEDTPEESTKGKKRPQINSEETQNFYPTNFPFFGPIMPSSTSDNWPPRGIDPRFIFPNSNSPIYNTVYPESYMGRPLMFENITAPVAPIITSDITRTCQKGHEKEEEEGSPVKQDQKGKKRRMRK